MTKLSRRYADHGAAGERALVTDKSGTRTLVSGVDLGVEPGYVTAVIGANGAGKSELVLGLAGMLPISVGKVRLDGRDMKGLAPAQATGAAAIAKTSATSAFVKPNAWRAACADRRKVASSPAWALRQAASSRGDSST